MNSLMVSIEWRVIAFLITNVFLWFVTGHFAQATALALGLHLILFFAHFVWHFIRREYPRMELEAAASRASERVV